MLGSNEIKVFCKFKINNQKLIYLVHFIIYNYKIKEIKEIKAVYQKNLFVYIK
jgi:hypothetical protein